MKSIKDIKKEIGYVEFRLSKTEFVIIPIYSLKMVKIGIRLETKQHELISQLHRMSNFYDENNFLLNGKKIEYGIILLKKRKKTIEFSEINKGIMTDLVVVDEIYRFTLTK
jgi:hypothetical protein